MLLSSRTRNGCQAGSSLGRKGKMGSWLELGLGLRLKTRGRLKPLLTLRQAPAKLTQVATWLLAQLLSHPPTQPLTQLLVRRPTPRPTYPLAAAISASRKPTSSSTTYPLRLPLSTKTISSNTSTLPSLSRTNSFPECPVLSAATSKCATRPAA